MRSRLAARLSRRTGSVLRPFSGGFRSVVSLAPALRLVCWAAGFRVSGKWGMPTSRSRGRSRCLHAMSGTWSWRRSPKHPVNNTCA